MSLTCLPLLGLFPSCWVILSSLGVRVLPCLIAFCCVPFACYLLEAFSFLKGEWISGEMRQGGGSERSGGRGSCGQELLYERRIYFR